MTKPEAIILGRRWAAIALALSSIGCANLSGQSVPDERFAGVLRMTFPGHSVFQAVNGEFYSVQIVGDEARGLMADRIRGADKTAPLCLELVFAGELLDEEDFVGRRIVAIQTLHHLGIASCV